jgi:hypothetical protein
MRRVKNRKVNLRDRQRRLNADAMPEVKRIVQKYGRLAVGNCLNKIKARDKEAARLNALKRQVAELERGLR